MSTARGTFEIQLQHEPPFDAAPGAMLARAKGLKQFDGDLEGSSTLEMLSAVSETRGSAGYVALERVTGTLEGRAGSFVLQHTGIMTRGTPSLNVAVFQA